MTCDKFPVMPTSSQELTQHHRGVVVQEVKQAASPANAFGILLLLPTAQAAC
jgi:hypothetical protein